MSFVKDIIDFIGKMFTWWVVVLPWEQGVRVTLGKRLTLMQAGIYMKIPLIHTVFVQEKRLRVVNLPMQTVSSQDGFALTISCAVGYSIVDVMKLYNTLYQPDMSIANIVTSKVSEYISTHELKNCRPKCIEEHVNSTMLATDYGLKYEYVRVINFAHVKTFRLIQDQSYMGEECDLKLSK